MLGQSAQASAEAVEEQQEIEKEEQGSLKHAEKKSVLTKKLTKLLL